MRTASCHPERAAYGTRGECKPCYMTRWNKEHPNSNSGPGWRKKNPEKARAIELRASLKKKGLTLAAFDALWEKQQGKCANVGCEKVFPRRSPSRVEETTLHVDHDHKTGRVRGLLCFACNTALGLLREDRAVIQGLAAYAQYNCG